MRGRRKVFWRIAYISFSCNHFSERPAACNLPGEDEKRMATNIAVYGLYRDRPSVEEAVESLKQTGFRNTDISVLLPDNTGSKDFALANSTKAPEGAIAGAGSGAVLGGALGWVAGIGLLAIPGLGPFIAAGPIMSLLAGAGVGGAFGSLIGALIGMGLPEYEARRFEGRIKKAGFYSRSIAITRNGSSAPNIVLTNSGASDVASAGRGSADFMVTDKPFPRSTKQGV